MAQAYESISRCLEAQAGKVVEIEILPSSLQRSRESEASVLVDGCSIGVFKKQLCRAVPHAAALLRAGHAPEERGHHHGRGPSPEVLVASQILLLFDPEHLTAANARKRYLLTREN